jgi:hypothetical protein
VVTFAETLEKVCLEIVEARFRGGAAARLSLQQLK